MKGKTLFRIKHKQRAKCGKLKNIIYYMLEINVENITKGFLIWFSAEKSGLF